MERASREEKVSLQLLVVLTITQSQKCPFLVYEGERGNRCMGMLKREGKRESGPKATNPRIVNKEWFSPFFCVAEHFILRLPGLEREVGLGLSF